LSISVLLDITFNLMLLYVLDITLFSERHLSILLLHIS
jgi:hypothetical protein